ncbi:MAG TPA: hypothetical protein VIL46_04430, partial [Gemmataceae bacterium]
AKPGSKPRRKKGGRDPLPVWLVLVIMLAPFLAVWLYFAPVDSGPSSESRGGSSYSGGSSNEQKLRAVLGNIPLTVEEAEWVEFDDNIVYVGFRTRPADLDALLRAWAVQGNAAINFGCHVWAVPASNPRSDPLRGGHYAEVTARYGRVE